MYCGALVPIPTLPLPAEDIKLKLPEYTLKDIEVDVDDIYASSTAPLFLQAYLYPWRNLIFPLYISNNSPGVVVPIPTLPLPLIKKYSAPVTLWTRIKLSAATVPLICKDAVGNLVPIPILAEPTVVPTESIVTTASVIAVADKAPLLFSKKCILPLALEPPPCVSVLSNTSEDFL